MGCRGRCRRRSAGLGSRLRAWSPSLSPNLGTPGQVRTVSLRFRKPTLYPVELRGRIFLSDTGLRGRDLSHREALLRPLRDDVPIHVDEEGLEVGLLVEAVFPHVGVLVGVDDENRPGLRDVALRVI